MKTEFDRKYLQIKSEYKNMILKKKKEFTDLLLKATLMEDEESVIELEKKFGVKIVGKASDGSSVRINIDGEQTFKI